MISSGAIDSASPTYEPAALAMGFIGEREAPRRLTGRWRSRLVAGAKWLWKQAVDETLDVRGVDEAVAIGVAGAGVAGCCAVEEDVDEELEV